MVYHTAFGQLDFAIGGYFVMSTIPIYPVLVDYVADIRFASSDMKWFIFNGAEDQVFPLLEGV